MLSLSLVNESNEIEHASSGFHARKDAESCSSRPALAQDSGELAELATPWRLVMGGGMSIIICLSGVVRPTYTDLENR